MNDTAALQQENDQLRAQLAERDRQISTLHERITLLLKGRFSPSSEKLSPDQLGLFNEAEDIIADQSDDEEEITDVQGHTRRRKPRISIPDSLPREEIVYDLSDADKVCPHDGTKLTVIGSEDHEQLDIIPAQIKVLRHKRLTYACPCCSSHVVTARKPKQPIEKSIASPGLLAFVATSKYADALPLYRQSEIFKRIGIDMDRTNLANWMIKCGELVQPLINLLNDTLQQQPCLHMDETTLQVLDEPGKTAQSKSYMWVMRSTGTQSACVFHYSDSRAQSVPLRLLSSDTPAIMVDGYEWYQKACDEYQITRLGCWAHARRKFKEAKDVQPKGKIGKADQGLNYIQKLYGIEQQTKDMPPDKRRAVRQEKAVPILEALNVWMKKSLITVAPKTSIGKALVYLNNQWDRLTGYVEEGHYPIDNNAAERAIRPYAIGRKNWLFSKSQAGATASANLYSLIETARANGLNEYDWLKQIFNVLPNAQSLADIEALLPWHCKDVVG